MNSPREAAPLGTAATVQARQSSKGMFGKRSTAPTPFWTRRKKITALSAIFGIIIGLGVTAAAGGTLMFTFQSQTDPFTAGSAIELRNLNAVRDDDTLTITGVLKNSGQTSISRLWIDNLAVSDIEAFQVRDALSITGDNTELGSDPTTTDDDLILLVKRLDSNDHMCIATNDPPSQCGVPNTGAYLTPNSPNNGTTIITTRQFDGISLSGVESVLEGGRTQAFKIVISCSSTNPTQACSLIDISSSVAISDRLTLTFGYASGDDRLVSDAYSARVRSG